MPELLTTDEAATYLRLSERKLYELVANGAVPCSKVTGRWLFPKAALDRWLIGRPGDAGRRWRSRRRRSSAAATIRCWNGRCAKAARGLASLPEGSEAGLRRLARGEVMAAAIHLHRLDGDDDDRQCRRGRARARPARRGGDRVRPARAGAAGRAGQSAATRRHRRRSPRRARASRCGRAAPARSFCCWRCWRAPASRSRRSNAVKPACPTGPDIAQAVRAGRADCGIATRSVAQAAGLDFVPLTWERFDLVLRQRDYFLPGPQALFDFVRGRAFRDRAAELRGYDVAETRSRPARQLRLAISRRRGLEKTRVRRHEMA